MQVDVTQQWREHRPLSGTQLRLHYRCAVEYPHVQALAHESQQRPSCDPNFEPLLELSAIQAVEEGHEVGLAEPPHLTLSHNPLQGAHGVLGTASRSEAIRALEKVWLVDGLQHRAHGVLDPCILERRDANRPRRALALGEVNPSDGLMAIPLGLQPRVQRLEIRL